GGAMLAVRMSVEGVGGLLGEECEVAAQNAARSCVISGPLEPIERLQERLQERRIASQRLQVEHAFHSRMMEPAVREFVQYLEGVKMGAPRMPFISCVSGRWIEAREAMDPNY